MFCCCPTPSLEGEQFPPILDVEQVLQEHVWKLYLDKLSRLQRACVRRNEFEVNVPMNYFHFEKCAKDKVWQRRRSELGKSDQAVIEHKNHQIVAENAALASKSKAKKKIDQLGTESNFVEIATDFINNTETAQTYKFRLEKTRKAGLTVTFQKGFTVGGKARFTLGLPKLASGSKAGGEVDMRLNITKTDSETIEETVALETTSDIQVKEKSKYVAKVIMAEHSVSYNFRVKTKMSMPSGGAPCSVLRRRDKKLFYSTVLKRLDRVFDKFQQVDLLEQKHAEDASVTFAVVLKTYGVVEGVRLADQQILLEASSLDDNKTKKEDKKGDSNEKDDDNDDDEEDGDEEEEDDDGEEEDEDVKEKREVKPQGKTLINVEYVPQQATIHPFTGTSQRGRGLGLVIKEEDEEEEEEKEKDNQKDMEKRAETGGTRDKSQQPPETLGRPADETRKGQVETKKPPISIGIIPAMVATSASPRALSPGSDKDNEASKTITTV